MRQRVSPREHLRRGNASDHHSVVGKNLVPVCEGLIGGDQH